MCWELCDHMIKDNILLHILMMYHKLRINLQRQIWQFSKICMCIFFKLSYQIFIFFKLLLRSAHCTLCTDHWHEIPPFQPLLAVRGVCSLWLLYAVCPPSHQSLVVSSACRVLCGWVSQLCADSWGALKHARYTVPLMLGHAEMSIPSQRMLPAKHGTWLWSSKSSALSPLNTQLRILL